MKDLVMDFIRENKNDFIEEITERWKENDFYLDWDLIRFEFENYGSCQVRYFKIEDFEVDDFISWIWIVFPWLKEDEIKETLIEIEEENPELGFFSIVSELIERLNVELIKILTEELGTSKFSFKGNTIIFEKEV